MPKTRSRIWNPNLKRKQIVLIGKLKDSDMTRLAKPKSLLAKKLLAMWRKCPTNSEFSAETVLEDKSQKLDGISGQKFGQCQ